MAVTKPDCLKCGFKHVCKRVTEEWQERVAICMDSGIDEKKAWKIACRQARGVEG